MLCAIVALVGLFLATCTQAAGGEQYIAFLCADNGTFSGLGELTFVSESVSNQIPLELAACQSAFTGTIVTGTTGATVPVVVVTTGIGAVAAALCTSSLLNALQVKSAFFVGTSGFSPVIGGFNPLAAGGCDVLSNPTTIAIGSVCITSSALDGSCGMCVSNPIASAGVAPSECSRPNCEGHTATSMYGTCSESLPNDLAEEVREANRLAEPPVQTPAIVQASREWWNANEAMDPETRQNPPQTPFVTSNCVEVDAHQIWVGAPMDYQCREYAGELLGLSPSEIVCTVAMESRGFLTAVRQSNQRDTVRVAVVRAASNWDMFPLVKVEGSTSWYQNNTYTSEGNHTAFVKASYQYAVLTSNQVILNYIRSL